jgi:hypothetical protein
VIEPVEQRISRDRLRLDRDDSGLESRDIEQAAEQAFERVEVGLDMTDDLARVGAQVERLECAQEQAECVQGLAQVVARSGEELRLGEARGLGRHARGDFAVLLAELVEKLDILEADADARRYGSRLQPPHQREDASVGDRGDRQYLIVETGEEDQPCEDEAIDDADEAE